jgi:hypothetical protein
VNERSRSEGLGKMIEADGTFAIDECGSVWLAKMLLSQHGPDGIMV